MAVTTMPSRYEGAEMRIPRSLAELHGPGTGVVTLPDRLAYTGSTSFDVTIPGRRLTLYTRLLDCGQRQDIVDFVHPELLREEWSRIRKLTSRTLIEIWERQLPELAAA